MAKLAVLAIHGIGSTERGYSAALEKRLRRELGARPNDLCFVEIDYQKHLRDNQAWLWERIIRRAAVGARTQIFALLLR